MFTLLQRNCGSDVRQGGSDPLSEEWQAQQLLLMRLSKPIDLQGSIIDISILTMESEEGKGFSVLPKKDNNTFLTFPFKDNAVHINHATESLTILNHPFFKFREPDDKL